MYDYKIVFDSLWSRPFVSMAILNGEGAVMDVTDGFARLVEKSRDNLYKHSINEVFTEIFDPVISDTPELPAFEKKYCFIENVRMWNGNTKSLEIAVIPLIPTENKLLIIRDKSDYQAAYSKLHSENQKLIIALENINDGVITTDKSDKIILLNNSIEQIFGLSKAEITGKSIVDLFVLFSANYSVYAGKMQFSTIFGMARNLADVVNDTVEVTVKDGQKKILLVTSTEMRDSIDEFSGFLYVIRDITEQIKIETQMHISTKMESIGQLAAGIAHEINTPMQYISDNTSFFKESFDTIKKYCDLFKNLVNNPDLDASNIKKILEEYKNLDIEYMMNEIPVAIEQTQTGISKVSKIVLAMKNFAHPGYKDKGYADINQAINETSVISRNEYKYYADLVLELDENLPSVFCLIDEVNQVILNMIINSSHAIKDKIDAGLIEKGLIRISTKANNEHVEIRIEDTGSGIKQDLIHRIYDPFFTTKEVGKGTGQGLSIAHHIIVQQHKGSITVDSAPGVGTVFTIKIPINSEENGKD